MRSDKETQSPSSSSPKRRQILQAAEDLFLAQGYGAVSMEAIARRADVSKATLYAYFTGKDALFSCIVADKGRENLLDESLFPEEEIDLRATLLTIGLRLMRFLQRSRTLALQRVVIAERARFPELGRIVYRNGPARFVARMAPWVALLGQRGLLRPCVPEVATQHFLALVRGDLFLRGALGMTPAPTEAEIAASVEAAVDAWLRAYQAPESGTAAS